MLYDTAIGFLTLTLQIKFYVSTFYPRGYTCYYGCLEMSKYKGLLIQHTLLEIFTI